MLAQYKVKYGWKFQVAKFIEHGRPDILRPETLLSPGKILKLPSCTLSGILKKIE